MFTCPCCNTALSERRIASLGLLWTCPSCHGRALTLDLLRKTIPKSLVDHLWQRARTDRGHTGRPCLACQLKMAEVPVIPEKNRTVCLEMCTNCYFVWFDSQEFEAMPKLGRKPSDLEGLSDEAKRALALARLELLKHEQITPEEAFLDMTARWRITLDVLWVLLDILVGW